MTLTTSVYLTRSNKIPQSNNTVVHKTCQLHLLNLTTSHIPALSLPSPHTIFRFITGVDLSECLIELLHRFILSVFSETLLGTVLQIPPQVVTAFLFFFFFFFRVRSPLKMTRWMTLGCLCWIRIKNNIAIMVLHNAASDGSQERYYYYYFY